MSKRYYYVAINSVGRILRFQSSHVRLDLGGNTDLLEIREPIDITSSDWFSYYDLNKFTVVTIPKLQGLTFNYETKEWEDHRTLEELKELRLAEVKDYKDSIIDAGFGYEGYVYDCDDQAQTRMHNALSLEDPHYWVLKDNSVITLSTEELSQVSMAMDEYVQGVFNWYTQMRLLINSAETKLELQSINIPQ